MTRSRTELQIGGVWVKAVVYARDDIVIKQGYENEAGQSRPSECSLTLNNTDGQYSPRNPLSPYFGKLGLNTQLRHSHLSETEYGLVLENTAAAAWTADSAALSITGDIDIRLDLHLLAPSDWTTADDDLASKFRSNDASRSWSLILLDGKLRFIWFENGTTASERIAESAVLPGPATGRRAVRVTLDVDDGAGNRVVKFYTAPTLAGPWTQHGSTITTAGTTQIFDGTGSLRIGANPDASNYTWTNTPNCVVYAAEIRNTIDGGAGTIVANPDFNAQDDLEPAPPGGTGGGTFTDTASTGSNVWAFEGPARVGHPIKRVRFHGEISSWPPSWDAGGMDPHIPIEASGIMRRIDQGTQPVNSGLRQHLLTTNPNVYWPLDDGPSSTEGANVSYPPFRFKKFTAFGPGPVAAFGEGDLGSYLPKGLQITSASNGNLMVGAVGNATSTDSAVEFVYRAEVLGFLTLTLQNNSNWDWKLKLRGDGTNNDVQLSLVDFSSGSPANVDLADTAPLTAITDGQTHHVRLRLTSAGVGGADTNYTVHVDGVQVISGTRTSHTLTGTANVHFAYDATGDDTPVAVGHVAAWTGTGLNPVPSIAGTSAAALGFAGEKAGRRAERLCAELDVPFQAVGNLDDTLAMGVQFTDYFSNQLKEIEDTDRGLLYDARAALALEYRTRSSLYNQSAKATINYAAGELAGSGLPFQPVDDDQLLRNDIFAQRREGSSYQATLTTGRLSVQEPPNGVGRYKDEQQFNLQSDGMLPEVAGWLLRLGTVDEARYPQVAFNLVKRAVTNPALVEALLDTGIGDRLAITNLDKLHIYDDVSILAVGYVEVANDNENEHTITFNCVPASPYEVLQFDDPESRFSPGDDSTLLAAATSDAPSLEVTGRNRVYWTSNAADLPIPITVAGEEISVTGVAGGSAPVFVGVGTSATGNNTSVTPGLPAGTQTGDLVFILASIRNSGTGTVNTPTGWTNITGGVSFGNVALLARFYDGAWSMPTITFTGGAANADTIAQSCAFRGVTWQGGQWMGDLNATAQNIALRADPSSLMGHDPVLVIFAGWKQDDWTTPNGADPPTGAVEIGEQVSTAGDDAGQTWAYRILKRDEDIKNLSFAITGGASAISRSLITTCLPKQTFTVTRAVNGVTKAQAAGEIVRLKREAGLGL